LKWDEPLPTELNKQFSVWFTDFKSLPTIKVPRCVVEPRCSFQLHTFCVASSEAYGTVTFLRCDVDSLVSVNVLQSRSRIKPIDDPATIPPKLIHLNICDVFNPPGSTILRLELLSCLLGVRLVNSLQEALTTITLKRFFWSDSSVAVNWIHGIDKVRPVFIENRVTEIRKSSFPEEWRHVPVEHNVADILTRERKLKKIFQTSWWLGPSWLKDDMSSWPVSAACDHNLIHDDRAAVPDDENIFHVLFAKYSSFYKTVRVLAYVMRIAKRLLGRSTDSTESIGSVKGADPKTIILSSEEFLDAEIMVLKHAQRNLNVVNMGDLSTFKDTKNIIRVKTKLTNCSFEAEFKAPIVLDGADSLVKALIRDTHLYNSHASVSTLITILREKFWILRNRKSVKQVIGNCVPCKRFSAKHCERADAPLPIQRVEQLHPFETCGIDLAGPLFLKDQSKVGIVLFTCSVYRAVHLELYSSLSTDAFLRVLRRFMARRGRIRTIFCDNGTNLRGAYNALQELDWARVTGAIQGSGFVSSPWYGWHFERLIGVMKHLLKRVLGHSILSYEELETVVADVEGTINSRPLTDISNDLHDLEPLTPAHFLHSLPSVEPIDLDLVEGDRLRLRLNCMQELREELRSRFKKEY